MGGDSARSDGTRFAARKNSKIFRNGEMLFGVTGSIRMHDILEHDFEIPEHHPNYGTRKFMVATFIPKIRETFKDKGVLEIEKNVESGGFFMVAYRGRLFEIESDFQVGEPARDFSCMGAGADWASGSIHSMTLESKCDGYPAKWFVQIALETAVEFCPFCRGPFTIKRLEGAKDDI